MYVISRLMISVSDYFSYSLEILISVSKRNNDVVTCQCSCNIIAIMHKGRGNGQQKTCHLL